jgi:hypothetical protein
MPTGLAMAGLTEKEKKNKANKPTNLDIWLNLRFRFDQ